MKNIKKEIKSLFESSHDRVSDISFYESALNEFDSGDYIKGIYAKALSLSDGDESKVKAKYLELRVEILKDEARQVARENIKKEDQAKRSIEDEFISDYEFENKEFLEKTLDSSLNKVSSVIGWYSLFGKIALVIYVLTLFSEEGVGILLFYGILFLFPFLVCKYIFKPKSFNSIKSRKKRVSLLFILAIGSSIFVPVIGWAFGIYLLIHFIKLQKAFRY